MTQARSRLVLAVVILAAARKGQRQEAIWRVGVGVPGGGTGVC